MCMNGIVDGCRMNAVLRTHKQMLHRQKTKTKNEREKKTTKMIDSIHKRKNKYFERQTFT